MNSLFTFDLRSPLTHAVPAPCTLPFSEDFASPTQLSTCPLFEKRWGYAHKSEPQAKLSGKNLLHDKEGAQSQRINARAIETAHCLTRIGNQRLTKKVKTRVHQNRSRRRFPKLLQQPPKAGIRFLLDGVNPDLAMVESELFQPL